MKPKSYIVSLLKLFIVVFLTLTVKKTNSFSFKDEHLLLD